MNRRIGGQRPRPRVALLGNFAAGDLEHFRRMFPTIWLGPNIDALKKLVDVREIDLIVIGSNVTFAGDWPYTTHIVCFSKKIQQLPGPVLHTYLEISGAAETEEFLLPDVSLPISRRREADYGNLLNVKGWLRLRLGFSIGISEDKLDAAKAIFQNGAIICERHTNSPLAVTFVREGTNLGVGWLPNVDINQAVWVELLVTQWAQSDKEAFPSFGDWTASPEWMVAEEEQILSQIQALEQKKKELLIDIDKRIGQLTTELALAKANANKRQRRLITAQGEELVDAVAEALKDIGFNVTHVDDLIVGKGPKREDLRLSHLDEVGKEWNAIVEVRGYDRSGGKTADLQRLARFANLYAKETGQAPDKRIYVVNGELELLPSQRQEPLASATEDLQIFSESDGILIWSIDLFRAIKAMELNDYPAILKSIKCAQGRGVPIDIPSPNEG